MSKTQRLASEAALTAKLAEKFAPPAFAFFPQVRNATGYSRVTRTADAVAMGLWPSRGLLLHGFEIKVTRADWLRELKQPEKADEIASRCDLWWIVVPDDTIVQPLELPAPWGLIAPRGGKLCEKKSATALNAKPVDRGFLAALMRAVFQGAPDRHLIDAEVQSRVAAERERIEASVQSNHQWLINSERDQRESAERRLAGLENDLRDFQIASGIDVRSFRGNGKKFGEALRLMTNETDLLFLNDLKRLSDTAKQIHNSIQHAISIFDTPKSKDSSASG